MSNTNNAPNFEKLDKLKDIIAQSWSKFKHYGKKNLKMVFFIKDEKVVLINYSELNKGFDYYRNKILKIKKSKKE